MDSLPLRVNGFKLPRRQESDVQTGLSIGGLRAEESWAAQMLYWRCLFSTLEDDSERTSAGFAL
jgi:hypothetical protein